MGIEHRYPTTACAKELYAKAIGCAAPGCEQPLYVVPVEASGRRTLSSRIAHIRARSAHGPRWDPEMSEEENRSPANLLVLCVEHAAELDDPRLATTYTVEVLQEWKAEQLEAFDHARDRSIGLTDEEAAELVEKSQEQAIQIEAAALSPGRGGRQAIGAARGGGRTIGQRAIGQRAIGTGGGARPLGSLVPAPPRRRQATLALGHVPGLDGTPDGDSPFARHGATGGARALAGSGHRSVSSSVGVSALMLAHHVESSQALAYISGGGWALYELLDLGTDVQWPVVVLVEAGGVPAGEYTITIEAENPEGHLRGAVSFPVVVEATGDILRIPVTLSLPVQVDELGLWVLRARSDAAVLNEITLLVQQAGEPPE